jgi:photosystem II stability/assembly factor-like uncharacterized protein
MRLKPLFVFMGFILLLESCQGACKPTGSWGSTALSNHTLLSISFPDPNQGWAVGKHGEILHSSDGGTTWAPQQTSQTTQDLNSVFFVSPQDGWAAGNAGTVLRTTTGGVTWGAVPLLGGATNYRQIFFLNNNDGWIVGGNILLATSNGGASWSVANTFPGQLLRGVHFVDPQHGWVVGEKGVVFVFSGGVWNQQISPTTKSLNSVYFVDVNTGIAVGGTGWTAGPEDGCYTSQGNPPTLVCPLPAPSMTQVMLRTTNQGQTWQQVFDQPGVPLHRVTFQDHDNGWTVGGSEFDVSRWPAGNPQPVGLPHGSIKATKDGGQTWTDQNTNFRPTFDIWVLKSAITPSPPATVFAVGDDSGMRWTVSGSNQYPKNGTYQKADDPQAMVFKTTNAGWP